MHDPSNHPFILHSHSTRPGSLLLTGYTTPLSSLPISTRARILHGWRTSMLAPLQGLFKSLNALGKVMFIRTSTPFYHLTGFPQAPPSWSPAASYPYEFLTFPLPDPSAARNRNPPVQIEVDIVIVGSGCGAGVAAHRLAHALPPGTRILVVEKGRHFDNSHFPMSQREGLANLFESGGIIETDDGSMTVTAGACFGGGGTINWSASLQTQHFVRREWADDRNLPFFESPAYQACLDRVCHVMDVSADSIVQNHGNRVLLEGARQLGYDAKPVPQNCGRESEHHDGYCTLGCHKGDKKGPVAGWFPEAARRGVKFVQGMKVDRVVWTEQGLKKGKKVAGGVRGTWSPLGLGGPEVKVVIKAKKVVVSCGTLWSPVVLLNSGLKVRVTFIDSGMKMAD